MFLFRLQSANIDFEIHATHYFISEDKHHHLNKNEAFVKALCFEEYLFLPSAQQKKLLGKNIHIWLSKNTILLAEGFDLFASNSPNSGSN